MLRRFGVWVAIVAVACAVGLLVTYYSAVVVRVEESMDTTPIPFDDRVVVVINDGSRRRADYARWLQKLKSQDPMGLGFDIYFARDPQMGKGSEELEKAIASCGFPVGSIIGAYPEDGPDEKPILFDSKGSGRPPKNFSLWSGKGLAYDLNATDEPSGPVTGIPVWDSTTDGHLLTPSLSVFVYGLLTGEETSMAIASQGHAESPPPLRLGGREVDLDKGEIPLLTLQASPATLDVPSFEKLLATPGALRGKVILVGGIGDKHAGAGGTMEYGTVMLARGALSLRAIVKGAAPTASREAVYLWVFVCAALAATLAGSRSGWTTALGSAAVVIVAANTRTLFVLAHYENAPTVAPLVAAIVATALSLLAKSLFEGPDEAGGEHEICCLFFDIADSTAMGGAMPASEVADLKQRIINRLARLVILRGGRVEATLGDGLYARFRSRNARQAVRRGLETAVRGVAIVEAMGPTLARMHGVQPHVRAGVEFGKAQFHMVLAERYKVVTSGSCVDLASRLIQVAKSAGKTIAVGPEAAKLSDLALTKLGEQNVSGFSQPVTVYSIEG
ncbi:MAG: adenylate/guanylate cyclase domain-containing protein [Fimbriimonadales bacterium]